MHRSEWRARGYVSALAGKDPTAIAVLQPAGFSSDDGLMQLLRPYLFSSIMNLINQNQRGPLLHIIIHNLIMRLKSSFKGYILKYKFLQERQIYYLVNRQKLVKQLNDLYIFWSKLV